MQVGEILLLEHFPPVYTFGLRQKDYAIHAEGLRNLGAEVHKVHSLCSLPLLLIASYVSGQKRRIGHISWSGTAGLLPHPQPQSTESKPLASLVSSTFTTFYVTALCVYILCHSV